MHSGFSRRSLLKAGAAMGIAALLPRAAAAAAGDGPVTLTAGEMPHLLPGCSEPSRFWGYNGTWPLELRVRRGQPFAAVLKNALPEHTAIHWHGLRIPFAMDGVPYFSQDPVEPGQSFRYAFTPPDPGTFFFHPHCDTVAQLGRGLAGVLIVEDPRDAGLFDQEQTLVIKDWRVRKDGSFREFSTAAGAAKAGTFGNLRTVNGGAAPTIVVRPGARLRLRLLNIDLTRIPMLGLRGAERAMVVATDGNACAPFAVDGWRLGPAMRADLALVMPMREGAEAFLEDIWSSKPHLLARIVTRGEAVRRDPGQPLTLPAAELPEPDLKAAGRLDFSLLAGHEDAGLAAWAKENGGGLDDLCLTRQVFWSINRQAWPGMGPGLKADPLFELKSGRSYVAEIFNGTPHTHPMHLHGHTFKVVGSTEEDVRPHWCDTVLVRPKERVRIAFVAGTPGDWMFHCHITEHQETGMMGYLRVI
ncbi:MAG TPA: multicopper oxidase family protein [Ferrovibrio sp.]|uniref:multicopper oxidase family protein n=1 Tax=Ferrovibrio sp. TaxID=1917215 RepID=UPI002ED159A8